MPLQLGLEPVIPDKVYISNLMCETTKLSLMTFTSQEAMGFLNATLTFLQNNVPAY